MEASLLLRTARRRELASPLGTSTYAANVCSRWGGFARTFSAKPTGNEVTGTDSGTTKSCGVMEGKVGQTDYTDEMWTKDREEIKRMKAEYEEHMRTCRKQMDAFFELERLAEHLGTRRTWRRRSRRRWGRLPQKPPPSSVSHRRC
ncbi:uncharacterized protein LOC119352928 isoform X2 [Triticum dicoccoides]|uniref:uncharacterized protein LOC119352928 isoform X2 n=1 Tax=Triticum dicoccoides TaxID=85692 RepID=UPI00188E2894|nr:uncharacterized protein LOC119352928 isoform X2 [Triticum dicoccoides]